MALSEAQTGRRPFCRRWSLPASIRASPNYPDRLPDMPCPLPRWTGPGARVGCFPARAAFPVIQAGRRPRLHFRGLLRIHSRYGLPSLLPHLSWALSRGFMQRFPSYARQLPVLPTTAGWVLPPPVICAVGAHYETGSSVLITSDPIWSFLTGLETYTENAGRSEPPLCWLPARNRQ